MTIELWPLARVKPYPRNARVIPERAIEKVAVSIREVWKAIPGIDGYEASSFGRIRSMDRRLSIQGRWGPVKRFHRGRILRLKKKPNGYLCFYADGHRWFHVSRSVAMAFHGAPPNELCEAAHLNGDKFCNFPGNLVWATHSENERHKSVHGTNPLGSRNAMHKLTESQIPELFKLYCGGESTASIADRHGVTPSALSMVLRGCTWGHVQIPSDLRVAAKTKSCANRMAALMQVNVKRQLACL